MLRAWGTKVPVYQGMTITQDELDRLTARATGWESVWNKLWGGLDERLHGMIISGSPTDEGSWWLKSTFRMFPDTHSAQDFIAQFIDDLRRKAEAGTLLLNFNGNCDQVLSYLAARDTVRLRALSYTGREARLGVTGMPTDAERAPTVRTIELDDDAGVTGMMETRGAATPGGFIGPSIPIEIAWDPSRGVNAKVRMAALQCWPRLDPAQVGLERLREDLLASIHSESGQAPLAELDRRHLAAARRIRRRLGEIQEEILGAPGMHAPTRVERDERRVALEVDLLLMPLSRKDVQELLALQSEDAAYQQLSRYRRAFEDLFPALQDRLEQVGAPT